MVSRIQATKAAHPVQARVFLPGEAGQVLHAAPQMPGGHFGTYVAFQLLSGAVAVAVECGHKDLGPLITLVTTQQGAHVPNRAVVPIPRPPGKTHRAASLVCQGR